ncbi:hypothetical protein MMC22_001226, partial [Lobaria immixta]|nr:hypothetical protein [Lobaria immixta]
IIALNIHYQQLKAEKKLAKLEQNVVELDKLEQNVVELEVERLKSFILKNLLVNTSHFNKNTLALERTTEIQAPKVYLKKSQQEL